ncbi:hypothetical protein BJX61DRAFT_540374 [Aspergillus egyptiacus]|nr:hypothetical protein BJX61DRAFT_540374 [Aspergillus egyptiacus]
MAMDRLVETFEHTSLNGGPHQPEQLLFNPPPDSGLQNALDNIPRYLFRVASPKSDGETTETWVHSHAASKDMSNSCEDIFSDLDDDKRTIIARTLNVHLRWWPKNGLEDNFVSWTSSLLFAIQYIYYRHHNKKDGSALKDIKLYVVDTTLYPRGTFIQDLDLIDFFQQYDDSQSGKNLLSLQRIRKKEWYFGEYLSQGALKIKGKNQVISANKLFRGGLLHRLQPCFGDINKEVPENKKPIWAKEVLRLRETIWPYEAHCETDLQRRLKAAGEIIDQFDTDWRFPLAVYFTSLIGPAWPQEQREQDERAIFSFFRSRSFYKELEYRDFSNFKVVAPNTMPELKQVKELVHNLHTGFLLGCGKKLAQEADELARHLTQANTEHGLAQSGRLRGRFAEQAQTLSLKLDQVRSMFEKVALASSPNTV